jgi:anti-sigma B factor antagonist
MALSEFELNDMETYAMGSVEVRLEPDLSIIGLVGDIDLAMRDDLDAACRQVLDRDVPVRIDAKALTFIDSSGLGFLTRIIKASKGGKRPELTGASPVILDTIRIVGLADLVELV